MNQLIRCRCGVWTTFGLACTSCKSTGVPYSDSEDTEEIVEPVVEEEDEEED
jgi:hypothetical protein